LIGGGGREKQGKRGEDPSLSPGTAKGVKGQCKKFGRPLWSAAKKTTSDSMGEGESFRKKKTEKKGRDKPVFLRKKLEGGGDPHEGGGKKRTQN